ncbi:GpE family phage tail protein [Providencia vermicola]
MKCTRHWCCQFFSTELPARDDRRRGRVIECPNIETDELIADIAIVFHWAPSEYDAMTVGEILLWHKRAAARTGNES